MLLLSLLLCACTKDDGSTDPADDSATDDSASVDTATDDTGTEDTEPVCSGGSGLSGAEFFEAEGASSWLYVPADGPDCMPLFLFGHGGNAPGGSIDGMWNDFMGTNLISEADRRGYALMVPHLVDGQSVQHSWSLGGVGELDAMITHALGRADIDQTRVIFAGTSAGGHMAAYYGLHHDSALKSHVAVMSAGIGGYFDYPEPAPETKLPFFVGHDPDDDVVPYSYSVQLAADLEANGHDHVFMDLDLGPNGHGWTSAATGEILDWWLGAD